MYKAAKHTSSQYRGKARGALQQHFYVQLCRQLQQNMLCICLELEFNCVPKRRLLTLEYTIIYNPSRGDIQSWIIFKHQKGPSLISAVQVKVISFIKIVFAGKKKKNPDLIIHRWRVNVNITIIFGHKLQFLCFWLHFDCSCTGLLVFALWLFHL